MADMPPYICDPNQDVHYDIELLDPDGVVVGGPLVANECTAAWLCEAAPFFGMWGPNYPLTWRHAPVEVGAPSVDEEQTPAP